ncbi:MAG: hypothetical protein C0525_01465 [Flavobacterium sp.]|uniref:hypothetical protein n=1 Tax=Flavobacterium sp. TaxID=239 RepID=UPI0025BAE156|nr:hypothetical protein [Flavobacterium sp.]MBA4133369.1 hypothetical protein [Flavobacterium sp.]
MEQLTTYSVKSKINGYEWVFKYHLDGSFKSFEILTGGLTQKQIDWLFDVVHFPYNEAGIKVWIHNLKANFEITKAAADISFEAFWVKYDLKIKKEASQKAWDKLKEPDQIKCFKSLQNYNAFLQRTGQAKAHLVTWINQKRFNDEY